MTISPKAFLTEKLPALYEKGVALLRAEADGGDARAKGHLDDVTAASGTGFVTIPGHGTVYLTVGNGKMTASTDRPAGSMRLAIEFPADAAIHLIKLGESKNAFEDDRAAIAAARTSSKRFEDALAGRKLSCHFTVKDAAVIDDDVTVKVAMNVDELPEKPGFTGELKYDDLVAVVEKKIQPQALMMGGKLKLKGDYSIAMQIGMQMMAQAGKR
jgi:putative sterol carrier protein